MKEGKEIQQSRSLSNLAKHMERRVSVITWASLIHDTRKIQAITIGPLRLFEEVSIDRDIYIDILKLVPRPIRYNNHKFLESRH